MTELKRPAVSAKLVDWQHRGIFLSKRRVQP